MTEKLNFNLIQFQLYSTHGWCCADNSGLDYHAYLADKEIFKKTEKPKI
jgi:hypothetical protein